MTNKQAIYIRVKPFIKNFFLSCAKSNNPVLSLQQYLEFELENIAKKKMTSKEWEAGVQEWKNLIEKK